jgi:hypothetical protein
VDYLCQTGHYFVLASKRTSASESKPLFGEGYICQRTRKFDQRRESGPRKLVKVAPRVALTAWSRPTMTWRAESGSRRNRKNLYVPRGLISSDSDKQPVPHRHRLLNLQRGLGRSASEPPKPVWFSQHSMSRPIWQRGPNQARHCRRGLLKPVYPEGCFRRFRAGTGGISRGTGFYLVRHGWSRSNRVH